MAYPGNLVDPASLYEGISETEFQRDVIKIARELNYEVYHHTTTGTKCRVCGTYVNKGRIVTSKGFPDLVMARMDPPRFIYVELKSQKGKQTKEQKYWQELLEVSDVEFYLWRPADREKLIEILTG